MKVNWLSNEKRNEICKKINLKDCIELNNYIKKDDSLRNNWWKKQNITINNGELIIENNSKNKYINITLDDFKNIDLFEININIEKIYNFFNNFTNNNNLEVLKLNLNSKVIPNNFFIKLSHLKELQLTTKHKINMKIEKNIFYGLNNLKILNLKNINYVKGIFIPLVNNLETLLLDNTIINIDLINELTKLNKLKRLMLNKCGIIDDINCLVNLETLYLDNSFNKSFNLKNFINLKEFYLNLSDFYNDEYYPKINNEQFSEQFNGLVNLKKLILKNCISDPIKEDFFKNLTNLEDLFISRNLSNIEPDYDNFLTRSYRSKMEVDFLNIDSFNKLAKLKNLKLQYIFSSFSFDKPNAIKFGIFNGLNNLEKLDLSFNYIKTIYTDTINLSVFDNLNKLKELNLSHNDLSEIEINTFNKLTNLEELNLSYNKIETINSSIFVNLKKLKKLNLSYNKIKTINYFSFIKLIKLENIDLKGNTINIVNNNIINTNKIYHLYNNLINIKIITDEETYNINNTKKLNNIKKFNLTIKNKNIIVKTSIISLNKITHNKIKKKIYNIVFNIFINQLKYKIESEWIKLLNITENYININKSLINLNIFENKNNKNDSMLFDEENINNMLNHIKKNTKKYSMKHINFIKKYITEMKESKSKINFYKNFFKKTNKNNLNNFDLFRLYELSSYLVLTNLNNILFYVIYFKIIDYDIYKLIEFFSFNIENINLDENIETELFNGSNRDTLLDKPLNIFL